MPYRRRNYKRSKPLRKVAKRATRRTSAKSQARQISTIARHLSTLKHEVREDMTMTAIYRQQFQCPLKSTNNFVNDIIVPLTCGVSQLPNPQPGYQPLTNLQLPASDPQSLQWLPIWQPRELKPNSGSANRASVPPWCKVYSQTCTIKFWSGTLAQPNTVTVTVLRANPKGAVSNIKSITSRLDGENHEGPTPDLASQIDYIAKGQDYAANDGISFGQPVSGQPPLQPSRNPSGSMNLKWNPELYTVEYQKQFTLGAALNPLRGNNQPVGDYVPERYQQAQFAPDQNQGSEYVNFRINYGGMKLSSVPELDSTSLALDPMEVTSMKYVDIPSEHKRWMVISQSNPVSGDAANCPYVQFAAQISTKVPT